MMTVGIDGGRHGGIVALWWDDEGPEPVLLWSAQADGPEGYYQAKAGVAVEPAALIGALEPVTTQTRAQLRDSTRVLLEAPGWYAGGGRRMNAGDAGRAGIEHGIWRAIMAVYGVPYVVVRPQVWQSHVGIPARGGKAAAIAMARKRVPVLVLMTGRRTTAHDGLADACDMALAMMEIERAREDDDECD